MGAYFLSNLKQRLSAPHIKEIRGKGLMLAIELMPDAGGARQYCHALMNKGLLCKETHEDIIRIAPPLVITRKEIDWALDNIVTVINNPLS